MFANKSVHDLVGLSPSKKIYITCFIESPVKAMENAFYSIFKALFVLKVYKLLSWLVLVMWKKWLD